MVTAREALARSHRVFLDTAPLIYFVQADERFDAAVAPFFERAARREVELVVSPITLCECLVLPLRQGDARLAAAFESILLDERSATMVPLSAEMGRRAARIRADHGIGATDALMLATAVVAGCDAFFTNDRRLRGIGEIEIVLVDELLE